MYTLPYDIKKPLTTHIVKGSYTYTNAESKKICSHHVLTNYSWFHSTITGRSSDLSIIISCRLPGCYQ